ncbi:MAG: COR domain-containing protein [Bacteroidia bacterium]
MLTQLSPQKITGNLADLIAYLPVKIEPSTWQKLNPFATEKQSQEPAKNQALFNEAGQLTGLIAKEITQTELHFGEEEKHLQHLNLSENKNLKKVSFTGTFPFLKRIYLNNCSLQVLDFFEANLPALEQLYVQNNQLEVLVLPQACRNLQLLDATNAGLTSLILNPIQPNLTHLFLYKSELSNVPKVHWDKEGNSAQEVLAYWVEANKGTKVNLQLKVILVGNGRAGKTSSSRVVGGNAFNSEEKYTHAIVLGEWQAENFPDLPQEITQAIAQQKAIETSKRDFLKIKVWDFGGQEIFYATHQFFLNEEAAYILVWANEQILLEHREKARKEAEANPEKSQDFIANDKIQPCAYWLDNILRNGKEANPLMVKTHYQEEKKRKLTCQEKELYKGEFLEFDAKTGHHLGELREKIADKLLEKWEDANHPFGNECATTYFELADLIEEKRNAGVFVLDFETNFKELCKTADIDAGNERFVAKWLHSIGEIVYFDENSQLQNSVYIHPEKLIEKLYLLLKDEKQLRKQKGKITQEYLATIYEIKEERESFVALLIKYQLIFEEKEGGYYIYPQCLPEKLGEEAAIFCEIIRNSLVPVFQFRFTKFLPENLIINFLCEYGADAQKLYWKNGICFAHKETKTPCIVECDVTTKTLRVYTQTDAHILQKEICDKFRELGKNAAVEISVSRTEENKIFVPMEEIIRQYEQKEKGQRSFLFEEDKRIYFSQHSFLFEKYQEQDKIEIKELIASNRLKEAFEQLFELYPLDDEVYLQSGRFHRNNEKYRQGIIPNAEHDQELNRINEALLGFVDIREREDS